MTFMLKTNDVECRSHFLIDEKQDFKNTCKIVGNSSKIQIIKNRKVA